jgi:hypothetical protein
MRLRHPGGQRNSASHDGDSGDHALFQIAHVHRPALSFAAAGAGPQTMHQEVEIARDTALKAHLLFQHSDHAAASEFMSII